MKKTILSFLAVLLLLTPVFTETCYTEAISVIEADLVLPYALTTIEDEAFLGVNATVVYLHDHVTEIGEKAFAGCPALQKIRIPASVTTIADSAFDECPSGLAIYGAKGSEAQWFAERKGFRFHDENDGDILLPEIYDTCSFASKKMFVSQFVKSVRVYRDYDLEIEFNVSFDEFKEFRRTGQSGDRSA